MFQEDLNLWLLGRVARQLVDLDIIGRSNDSYPYELEIVALVAAVQEHLPFVARPALQQISAVHAPTVLHQWHFSTCGSCTWCHVGMLLHVFVKPRSVDGAMAP
jgi:hypothetical protein